MLNLKEIEEKYNYNIYDQYKFLVKDLVGKEIKKIVNHTITFEDLTNVAFEAVMAAHNNYNGKSDIKTHVYNTIKYYLYDYRSKNASSIKVSHVENFDKIKYGYNSRKVRKVEEKYNKMLEDGLIDLEKYNKIVEFAKKEFKIVDFEEYKENMYYKRGDKDDSIEDNRNSFEESIIYNEEDYKQIDQRDFISKLLLKCFDKNYVNKQDVIVIKEYFENNEKKNGFSTAIKKIQRAINIDKELKEFKELGVF